MNDTAPTATSEPTVSSGSTMSSGTTIAPEDQAMAAITHLSGLAGYIIPLAGVIAPIIIWMMRTDSPVISGIAKQALLLNLLVFVLGAGAALLLLTIILIPLVFLFWIVLAVAALVLPIVGAIKASQGEYYRYPVIGQPPA